MKIKLSAFLILIILPLFSLPVYASDYIEPTVAGVISSSDSAYRPSVTYPEWNTISGHYLYYSSNWDNILTIVDIADPMNPVEMSSLHDGDTGAIIKSPKGIMVVGDYAYFINWDNATGNEIVEILNIADKSHPYHVSAYTFSVGTGDKTYSLFVKDDYIYIPNAGANSLTIIDARDKAHPVLAGSISNGTNGAKLSIPYNVYVVGDYAYVTAYSSAALEVVNVANKANPTHVAYLLNGTNGAKLSGAAGLQIIGDYAYIMSYSGKALEIVNISSSTNPVHAGVISDGTNGAKIYGYELAVNGSYAYLSSYSSHALEIVDISNPANPTHVSTLNDGDNGAALHRTRSVAYYNNTIYSSVTGSNRVEIIDVSSPASPTHINQIDPSINLGGPRFVKIHNGLAYVTAGNSNALQIVDISDKKHPSPRGSINLRYNGAKLYSPLGMDFRGNYAYIVSTSANFGFGALEIVDISDPDNPVHVNSTVDGIYAGGVQNIKIVGNYGYITVSGRNTLEVIDIASNPTNPAHVGSISNGSGGASLTTPFGIDIVGNYAYVTTSNALEIINISSSTNPTHVSSLANGSGGALLSSAKYINVIGSYAYIACSGSNALEIVNISSSTNPVHAGSLANGSGGAKLGGAYGLKVSDGRAYVGSSVSNALEIIDVSNPASPTHLYTISDGDNGARLISARGVDLDGEYVYATAYNGSSNALNIIEIKEIAPTSLSYASSSVFTKNTAASSLSPTSVGTNITYSISPALPNGLAISSSTGIISGTPTATSSRTNYVVTATNSGGYITANLSITVNHQAPGPLSYKSSDFNYLLDKSIDSLVPDISGEDLVFSVSPELPAGLSLDTASGIISGKPTRVSETATYSLTATNSGGSSATSLKINIYPPSSPIILPLAVGLGQSNFSISMNATQSLGEINGGGANVLLYINSQANFSVPNSSNNSQSKDYSFKIKDLDLYKNMITLSLSPNSKILSLNKGESREVDLDGDGLNDIYFSFPNIYNNRAEITIKPLIIKEYPVKVSPTQVSPAKASSNQALPKATEEPATFRKDLKFNMVDSDVKELQKFLNKSGYPVSRFGAGSKDRETNIFGLATKNALIKFQKAKKISPASGFFGPATRKVVNSQ